jgi:hypothetical protein
VSARSAAIVVIAVVAFGLACSAPSGKESARTGAVEQPIRGGQIDDADRYAVGVCHGAAGVCADGTCSGALILPNVVATARHCVEEAPTSGVDCVAPDAGAEVFGGRKPGSYFVTTNTRLDSDPAGPGWYAVTSIVVPPEAQFCGNDIALLILGGLVPATDAKPITPGVQYLMWDPDQYTPVFSAIGYGQTQPVGTPGGESGTRHRLDGIKVQCIPGSDDLDCTPYNANEFAGGEGVCAGDSGSSAFEKTSLDKGAPVSFGVLSRGDPNCVGSTYTRFDAHRDFVLQSAKVASNGYTLYPEPPWTAPKPPPQRKDAGVPSPPAPSKAPLGTACGSEADCASGLCAATGAGKVCSVACVGSGPDSCPDGFACKQSLCQKGSIVNADDGGGCGAGGGAGPESAFPTLLLGAFMGALARARRQRRSQRRAQK